MTWEITIGIFTLIGAFSAVMQVVMKVNKTLVGLDDSGKQLKKFMEKQARKNEDFIKKLAQHELRLSRLESSEKESNNGKA